MTHLIDQMIAASLWLGATYLAVGFIAFAIKRGSNAVLSSQQPVPVEAIAAVEVDPVAEALELIEQAYRDVIVPFHRPQRDYSDLALIRLAKSLAKKGQYSRSALKWSYDRKLSQSVKDALLQLARQSA